MLVVEDDPAVASSTTEILRAEGFVVATAATVESALYMMTTWEVRSIILDHHLDSGDGESLLDRGQHLPPVIVVSAMGHDALAELRVAGGEQLFACLAKPVAPSQLIKVVRAALGNR